MKLIVISILSVMFLCQLSFADENRALSHGYSAVNKANCVEDAICNAKESIVKQVGLSLLKEGTDCNFLVKNSDDYITDYRIVPNSQKILSQNKMSLAINASVDFEKVYYDLYNSHQAANLKTPVVLVQVDSFENGQSVDSCKIAEDFNKYLSGDFKTVSSDICKSILQNNLTVSKRKDKIMELARTKKVDFVVFASVITSDYQLREKNMCNSKSVLRLECFSVQTKKKIYETSKPVVISETGNIAECMMESTSVTVVLSFFEDYKIRFKDTLYGAFARDLYFSKNI